MLNENFVKTIETSLKKHWDLPALSDYQGQPLSYGDVAAQIIRLHAIFRKNHAGHCHEGMCGKQAWSKPDGH